ncbi:uncharacterized protein METZ01_LOCUS252921 [marine metagenome]|uniref:Uncharacterized protein n=1 Tax=marine metagenome TaxID=408172 RepID=A0A382ILH3_9ZZZZ
MHRGIVDAHSHLGKGIVPDPRSILNRFGYRQELPIENDEI